MTRTTSRDLVAIQERIDQAQRASHDPTPKPSGIIDGDGIQDDLLCWTGENGVSLDWIFRGEVEGLLRYTSAHLKSATS